MIYNRALYRVQQQLIVKGFFDKIGGTRLHCLHRDLNITMTGEHDDR